MAQDGGSRDNAAADAGQQEQLPEAAVKRSLETIERQRSLETIEEKSLVQTTTEDRGEFDNKIQFILTCVGLAVGLGNIWRFPSLAYKHGGTAFMIPYVTCSLLFGLPCLYLEFVLGQLTRSGPAFTFYHFMPALQGVGWSMTLVAASIGVYYSLIIAWVTLYIAAICMKKYEKWSRCDNDWNSHSCFSLLQNKECAEEKNSTEKYFFIRNDSSEKYSIPFGCQPATEFPNGTLPFNYTIQAAEEFFTEHILKRSGGIADGFDMNWEMLVTVFFMWVLVGLILWKGVDTLGKSAYVTATLPYVIVVVLCGFSLSLPGGFDGLKYYLFNMETFKDPIKFFHKEIWRDALTQLCFSLSIGWGGLLAMASYSNKSNNCYRDALIVCVCDCLMSIVGGSAVFAVLGHLSHETGTDIDKLVSAGSALAFITYPEGISQMPLPWLWGILFLSILFLLGISTLVTIAETVTMSIQDCFPAMRTKRMILLPSVCLAFFIFALPMCTSSGYYWYELYNEYTGTTWLCASIVLEIIIVIYCYGVRRLCRDIEKMIGHGNGLLMRCVGPSSYYLQFTWLVSAPLLVIFVGVLLTYKDLPKLKIQGEDYLFPDWAIALGWILAVGPGIAVPIYFVVNLIKFKRAGKPLCLLFKLQPSHPSYVPPPRALSIKRKVEEEEAEKMIEEEDKPPTSEHEDNKKSTPDSPPISALEPPKESHTLNENNEENEEKEEKGENNEENE